MGVSVSKYTVRGNVLIIEEGEERNCDGIHNEILPHLKPTDPFYDRRFISVLNNDSECLSSILLTTSSRTRQKANDVDRERIQFKKFKRE